MIRARLHPSTGLHAGDLLRAARQILMKAREEADRVTASARASVARAVFEMRRRLRRAAERRLKQKEAQLRLGLELEAERRYREVVAQAYRDCLEIALAVAREAVGELGARSQNIAAERVRKRLETLVCGRPLEISVNSADLPNLRALLDSAPLIENDVVPRGKMRVLTAAGALDISLQDELPEIAVRLRAALEAKIRSGEL